MKYFLLIFSLFSKNFEPNLLLAMFIELLLYILKNAVLSPEICPSFVDGFEGN